MNRPILGPTDRRTPALDRVLSALVPVLTVPTDSSPAYRSRPMGARPQQVQPFTGLTTHRCHHSGVVTTCPVYRLAFDDRLLDHDVAGAGLA